MADKQLSLFDCVMLGVGSALGPEIFLLLGIASAIVGTHIVISIAIAFGMALLVGLCYAELATSIPKSGEDYVFARQAFHGMLPFIVGWIVWFGNIVYVSFNAIAIAYFLKFLVTLPIALTAIIAIAFSAYLLFRGMDALKKVQNLLVGGLILCLAYFVFSTTSSHWFFIDNVENGDLGAIISTAAMLFIAFIGFEDIVSVAAEVKEPKKTIPIAIVATLLILAIIYIAIAFAVFSVLPLSAIITSENPVLDAAEIAIGSFGKILLSIAGLLAIITSVNAAMTAASMNAYALGRDRYLPRRLASLSHHGTATYAILLTATISIVFAATETVSLLVYLTDFSYFIAMAISAYALITLRKKQPGLERPFKVPFYPYTPIFAIILSSIAIALLHPESLAIGTLWLLGGILAYYLYVIGLTRILIAIGGILMLFSIIFFITYLLIEAGHFSIPKYGVFNLNGVILMLAIGLSALATYLILDKGKALLNPNVKKG